MEDRPPVEPSVAEKSLSAGEPVDSATEQGSTVEKQDPRDVPGSSRTVYTGPSPTLGSGKATVEVLPADDIIQSDTLADDRSETHAPFSDQKDPVAMEVDATDTAHTAYRPPEPVVDTEEAVPDWVQPMIVDDAQAASTAADVFKDQKLWTSPPGRVTQLGVIDGNPVDPEDFLRYIDDSGADGEVDDGQMERPQIGPGVTSRRLLELLHPHPLVRPVIHSLPAPAAKKVGPDGAAAAVAAPEGPSTPRMSYSASVGRPVISPTDSTGSPSSSSKPAAGSPPKASAAADYQTIYTIDDVKAALPGGLEHYQDWYFCSQCWAWKYVRASSRRGVDAASHAEVKVESMADWSARNRPSADAGTNAPAGSKQFSDAEQLRLRTLANYNDLLLARDMVEHVCDHMHDFHGRLVDVPSASRVQSIELPANVNAFPHLDLMTDEERHEFPAQRPSASVLWASCSSETYLLTDNALVLGQIPASLINAFVMEKLGNPGPHGKGENSVVEALTMLSTLLGNALFRGQRGWVSLENDRFKTKLGTSILSLQVLASIGFGCRQEEHVLRVGPVQKGESITEEDVQRMDRYMLRTWVEINLALRLFMARQEVESTQQTVFVDYCPIEDILDQTFQWSQCPVRQTEYPHHVLPNVHSLGAEAHEVAASIERAYDLQVSCNAVDRPQYLLDLERISQTSIGGQEALQTKVSIERSLGRYSIEDVKDAYRTIGYDHDHVQMLSVEPDEAPDDYILRMCQTALDNTLPGSDARQRVLEAVRFIGKHRASDEISRVANPDMRPRLTVEEAYKALSAPPEADDEGLIMQFEEATREYPAKAEHYRMCLSVIAEAPGAERPGLQSYLTTGVQAPDQPPRKDLPVGLKNIANTCYLNSILQFLYSIKPLRDAVLAFEQDSDATSTSVVRKPEVERSRRLVRQLRLLFQQLYESEASAVEPTVELAALAITRPNMPVAAETHNAGPSKTGASILDSIPDAPSPSSTMVNSSVSSQAPSPEPQTLEPAAPAAETPITGLEQDRATEMRDTVLGKRASEDRASRESSAELASRSRLRSEDAFSTFSDVQETPSMADTPMSEADGLVLVLKADESDKLDFDSPLVEPGLAKLEIQSPAATDEPSQTTLPATTEGKDAEDAEDKENIAPAATVPPPLPARPVPVLARQESALEEGLKFGMQQDSAEVLLNIVAQLEMAFELPPREDGSAQTNLITSLFSRKYTQQILLEKSDGTTEPQSAVEGVFNHPIVGVEEEGKDLYDCLGELYLQGDEVGESDKRSIWTLIDRGFPPIVYIQMARSQYDHELRRERKTNTHIPFGQVLSMDRFLATADSSKRERSIELTRQMARLRARLHQLRKSKAVPLQEAITTVHDWLSKQAGDATLGITPDFLDALSGQAAIFEDEAKSSEERLHAAKRDLEQIWQDSGECQYQLVSVFMHRGMSSASGHYWTYQSDLPDRPNRFFMLNDERVSEVTSEEVLKDRKDDDPTANPALLCYVRTDMCAVESLHRAVLDRERELEAEAESKEAKESNGAVEGEEAAEPLLVEL